MGATGGASEEKSNSLSASRSSCCSRGRVRQARGQAAQRSEALLSTNRQPAAPASPACSRSPCLPCWAGARDGALQDTWSRLPARPHLMHLPSKAVCGATALQLSPACQ